MESGNYYSDGNIKILTKSLEPIINADCKNVILGCTHYPYLIDVLKELSKNKINFINPAKDFTNFIKKDLKEKELLSSKRDFEPQFYVSDNPQNFFDASKGFYPLKELPQIVSI